MNEFNESKLSALLPTLTISNFKILSPCLIVFTTEIPSITLPKIVCLLSNHGVSICVIKN